MKKIKANLNGLKGVLVLLCLLTIPFAGRAAKTQPATISEVNSFLGAKKNPVLHINYGGGGIDWTNFWGSDNVQYDEENQRYIFEHFEVTGGNWFYFSVRDADNTDNEIGVIAAGDSTGQDQTLGTSDWTELYLLKNESGYKSFNAPQGEYRIIIDFSGDKAKIKLEEYAINEMYLFGGAAGGWNANDPKIKGIKSERDGKVIFTFPNAYYKIDGTNDWRAYFRFFINGKRNGQSLQVLPASGSDCVVTSNAQEFTYKLNTSDSGAKSFVLPKNAGYYTIVVELEEDGKASIYYADPTNQIRFWEGPFATGFGIDVPNYFEEYPTNETDRKVWRLVVPKSGQNAIKYVSQCDLRIGGTNADFNTAYFDAHTPNTLVPIYQNNDDYEFWCNNSRMEVGIEAKAIYLIKMNNESVDAEKGETPYYIMFSTDGNYIERANKQVALNKDRYFITLSEGVIYDALKGTQTGDITVPFIRHHIAKEGYSINLGKTVKVTGKEKFTFHVNDKNRAYDKQVTLSQVYDSKDEGEYAVQGDESLIDASAQKDGLEFNKIILMVENSADENVVDGSYYDRFRFYLAGIEEPEEFYTNGYDDKDRITSRNPLLKIWTSNNADDKSVWDGLYNNSAKSPESLVDENDKATSIVPEAVDGTVKYFKFKAMYSDMEYDETQDFGKKTNIYHLDFPGGIKIKKGQQFNIVDNEGYDISNPYQGSQYLYTDEWWCANPSLGYGTLNELANVFNSVIRSDNTTFRRYGGYYFPAATEGLSSRVDLAWGDEEETIYGITIFKIMGSGYDVYAEGIRDRALYYVYASKTPISETVATQDDAVHTNPENFERTAPIVLAVKGKDIFAGKGLKEFTPSKNNSSNLSTKGVKYYTLTLHEKELSGNDDLNYVLCKNDGGTMEDVTFTPEDANAFEFVDITGLQTWDAFGEKDKLTPNKWSNYYSTYDEDANSLTIDQTGIEYFRLVLATNPDAVRYQILATETDLMTDKDLHYANINKPVALSDEADYEVAYAIDESGKTLNKAEAYWMYPTAKLSGNFFWNNDCKSIEVDMTIEDQNNNTVTIPVANIEYDSDKGLYDTLNPDAADNFEIQGSDEAFVEEGEYIFTYNVGEFFVNPDWKVTASVKYNDKEAKTVDVELISYDAAPISKVEEMTYDNATDWQDHSTYVQSLESYLIQLKWINDDSNAKYDGLPRTYRIEAQQQTQQPANGGDWDVVNIVDGDADEALHDGYILTDNDSDYFGLHNDKYYTWYRDENIDADVVKYNAMSIKAGPTTASRILTKKVDGENVNYIEGYEDQKVVTIRYTVTPVYHYAVPVALPEELNDMLKVTADSDMSQLFEQAPASYLAKKESTQANAPRRASALANDRFTHVLIDEAENANYVDVDYYVDRTVATGVDGVTVEVEEANGPVEIYTLQGVRIYGEPEPGIYIFRRGSETHKVLVR